MWYNTPMSWLLRSPLHSMISKNFMLITYRGRKSGKTFTTPVNYVCIGNELMVISLRHRSWWRNLRGGARVSVRVQGQERQARGQAIEEPQTVAAYLTRFLQESPHSARYMNVSLDANGQPDPAGVARAAEDRVIVRLELARS